MKEVSTVLPNSEERKQTGRDIDTLWSARGSVAETSQDISKFLKKNSYFFSVKELISIDLWGALKEKGSSIFGLVVWIPTTGITALFLGYSA